MSVGVKDSVRYVGMAFFAVAILIGSINIGTALAQQASDSDFGLHITPSPLIADLKPGKTTTLEMEVTNTGRNTENLRISPREFEVDKKTGEIKLLDTAPPEIENWISFSADTFSVKPGERYKQKVKIALPSETGFSYSFTLLISRTAGGDAEVSSGASLKGSVAVFTLLNVDRPGAVRQFEVSDFTTSQAVYEYLPTEFQTTFQNTGNTIVQPFGNVFVQRGSSDKEPIAVLKVNPVKGYILPGTPRTLTTSWGDGFPAYKTETGADGQPKQELIWDWSKIADFRIGLYTAKLVAVYNDGQRDIPVERTVQFWVIPWRIILIFLTITTVFAVGVWVILRKGGKMIRSKKKKKTTDSEE